MKSYILILLTGIGMISCTQNGVTVKQQELRDIFIQETELINLQRKDNSKLSLEAEFDRDTLTYTLTFMYGVQKTKDEWAKNAEFVFNLYADIIGGTGVHFMVIKFILKDNLSYCYTYEMGYNNSGEVCKYRLLYVR